jgi:hypothetical protein
MTKRILRSLVLPCLALVFTLNLLAGASDAGSLLRQAYAALEVADHDYKGHRAEAMKQIHEAGKVLGITIKGEGKGHEKQVVSDNQLRQAQQLLEQSRSALSGKALQHVEAAIKQITTALSIK